MTQELENTFLSAIEQNQQKLLRICSVYAKDKEDLKVLFQETLVRIWEAMPSLQEESTLEAGICRITLNVCLQIQPKPATKKNKLISISDKSEATKDPNTEKLLRKVKSGIQKLNEADKSLLILNLEGFSNKAISGVIGLDENKTETKINQIQKELLNSMNEIQRENEISEIWQSAENEVHMTFEKSGLTASLQGLVDGFKKVMTIRKVIPFILAGATTPAFIFYMYWSPQIFVKIASAWIIGCAFYYLLFFVRFNKQNKPITLTKAYIVYLKESEKLWSFVKKMNWLALPRIVLPMMLGILAFSVGIILEAPPEKQIPVMIMMIMGTLSLSLLTLFAFNKEFKKRILPPLNKIENILKAI